MPIVKDTGEILKNAEKGLQAVPADSAAGRRHEASSKLALSRSCCIRPTSINQFKFY